MSKRKRFTPEEDQILMLATREYGGITAAARRLGRPSRSCHHRLIILRRKYPQQIAVIAGRGAAPRYTAAEDEALLLAAQHRGGMAAVASQLGRIPLSCYKRLLYLRRRHPELVKQFDVILRRKYPQQIAVIAGRGVAPRYTAAEDEALLLAAQHRGGMAAVASQLGRIPLSCYQRLLYLRRRHPELVKQFDIPPHTPEPRWTVAEDRALIAHGSETKAGYKTFAEQLGRTRNAGSHRATWLKRNRPEFVRAVLDVVLAR